MQPSPVLEPGRDLKLLGLHLERKRSQSLRRQRDALQLAQRAQGRDHDCARSSQAYAARDRGPPAKCRRGGVRHEQPRKPPHRRLDRFARGLDGAALVRDAPLRPRLGAEGRDRDCHHGPAVAVRWIAGQSGPGAGGASAPNFTAGHRAAPAPGHAAPVPAWNRSGRTPGTRRSSPPANRCRDGAVPRPAARPRSVRRPPAHDGARR